MQDNLPVKTGSNFAAANAEFVTLSIADQLFGIPVLEVRDVLRRQSIAHIPLAPPEVAGALNLRGRIVTAINLRQRLGLPDGAEDGQTMSVVVEHKGELYSLIADKVSEVLSLPAADFEKNPPTLDSRWQDVSRGVYRLKEALLIVLDVARLLHFSPDSAAA